MRNFESENFPSVLDIEKVFKDNDVEINDATRMAIDNYESRLKRDKSLYDASEILK
jgi:hypothetical protein